MLVSRIANGNKLAMQVLFARRRIRVYRWLLRFVGNETVAEDLLSDVFSMCGSKLIALKGVSPLRRGCWRWPVSRPSPHVAAARWSCARSFQAFDQLCGSRGALHERFKGPFSEG
jgi:hypothetical protein